MREMKAFIFRSGQEYRDFLL